MGHLLTGLVFVAAAIGLLVLGLPNWRGESPRFLRFSAAPMLYPPLILVLFALGTAELITSATMSK